VTISALLAGVREWLRAGPKGFYRHHLDEVCALPDADLADIVRFARTLSGARMALTHHMRTKYHV
jgi:hypothetical protein